VKVGLQFTISTTSQQKNEKIVEIEVIFYVMKEQIKVE
jgi:hypothetical protein